MEREKKKTAEVAHKAGSRAPGAHPAQKARVGELIWRPVRPACSPGLIRIVFINLAPPCLAMAARCGGNSPTDKTDTGMYSAFMRHSARCLFPPDPAAATRFMGGPALALQPARRGSVRRSP
ncbi:hypothetical protein MRX96_015125 [Rhipicephalus microplus]